MAGQWQQSSHENDFPCLEVGTHPGTERKKRERSAYAAVPNMSDQQRGNSAGIEGGQCTLQAPSHTSTLEPREHANTILQNLNTAFP